MKTLLMRIFNWIDREFFPTPYFLTKTVAVLIREQKGKTAWQTFQNYLP